MTTLVASGITDPGQVRTQNQDAFFVGEDLVLIADGMGGYAGGEVAAQIAADVVGERFSDDRSADGLRDAVADANRQIYERGVEPGLEGMGTTLVALAVVTTDPAPRLLLANVGDSRAYLLRDGGLRQLTEDHSVAAELVRLGRLEEEEGAEHPGRHVLTRALGVERDVEPDLIEIEPQPGDRLLLCSDGLSNELDDEQIRSMLTVGEPSDAARALVAAANAHGGLDNITAVVADVVEPATPPVLVEEPTSAVVAGNGGGARGGGAPASTALVSSSAGPITSSVGVVASTATVHHTTSVLPQGPSLAVRPVLSGRERRRRRREDRRDRRAYNKWVSFRGTLFLLALVGVLVGGYAVLRWYGTENYMVTVRGDQLVIVQGQPGGFLWWPQKVVVSEHFGLHQIPLAARRSVVAGVTEPSLADAKRFIANIHGQWTNTTSTTAPTTTSTFTGGT